MMIRSAKLWKDADQKQLDDEVHALLNDEKYVPKVLFETPRGLKEAAASLDGGVWQPEIQQTAEKTEDNIPTKDVEPNVAVTASPTPSDSEPAPEQAQGSDDVAPGLDSLAQVEAQIQKLKEELRKASSYGGGFDVTGRPVKMRSDSKRPTSIEPEIWGNYTEKQRERAETDKTDSTQTRD
jgi:hypothetical protein